MYVYALIISIDENHRDLSGILICQILFSSGYGHRHINGSLNFILHIFRMIFFSGHSHL